LEEVEVRRLHWSGYFRKLTKSGFLVGLVVWVPLMPAGADQAAAPETLWKTLEPFAKAPAGFEGKFGPYRSPLPFADGSIAKTPADWARRRQEIVQTWHKRLGAWPKLLDRPAIKRLQTVERDGYTEQRVAVQVWPNGTWLEGYLLVPKGPGPFPAVIVP